MADLNKEVTPLTTKMQIDDMLREQLERYHWENPNSEVSQSNLSTKEKDDLFKALIEWYALHKRE